MPLVSTCNKPLLFTVQKSSSQGTVIILASYSCELLCHWVLVCGWDLGLWGGQLCHWCGVSSCLWGVKPFGVRKTSSPLVWVSKLAGEGEQKTSD